MPAHGPEVGRVDAVLRAEGLEVAAHAGPLCAPPADAHVHVVAFREDPRVAARDNAELEDEQPAPGVGREPVVGKVSLECDPVDDSAREVERPGRRPIGAVRADNRVDLDRLAPDSQACVGLDRGTDAHAELRPDLCGLLGEERVEPAPLRHQAELTRRLVLDLLPVAQAAPDAGDAILDDGLDRERELADRAHRQTAAAGLVAREPRFVD